jgi:hypothetical protein
VLILVDFLIFFLELSDFLGLASLGSLVHEGVNRRSIWITCMREDLLPGSTDWVVIVCWDTWNSRVVILFRVWLLVQGNSRIVSVILLAEDLLVNVFVLHIVLIQLSLCFLELTFFLFHYRLEASCMTAAYGLRAFRNHIRLWLVRDVNFKVLRKWIGFH